jgi:hypothetical protein
LPSHLKIIFVDKTIKRNSFVLGILGAILTIAIYLYIWKNQEYTNTDIGLAIKLYPILLGIIAQILARRAGKGIVSFKQVVLAYFICILIVFFTEALINYLIFNVFDPSAKELANDALRSVHAKTHSSLAQSQNFTESSYSAGELIKGFFPGVLLCMIPGLITGIIISKAPQR